MPPFLPLAALAGLALLFFGKKSASDAPAATNADVSSPGPAAPAARKEMAADALHKVGTSAEPSGLAKLLTEPPELHHDGDKPPPRLNPGDVVNRGVGAISKAEPYSPRWYKDWARALGVKEPFPVKWSKLPEDKPLTWGAYNRERTLRNTAHKLIAWPAPGDPGGPQRFAAEFLLRGEALGPSPTKGDTRYTWGPWQGLTAKGAKLAESLLYTPVDYDIHNDPQRILDGVKNPRRMIAASILETIGPILAFVPFVGSLLALGAETAASVLEGKGVDVDELLSKGEAVFTDVTGIEMPEQVTQTTDELKKLDLNIGGV